MCWFFWDATIFCNNFARWLQKIVVSFVTTLCSPNEDFLRTNEPFRMRFRSTFQRFVAQIRYSNPWKVLRKRTLKGSFVLPKSSFGRGKLCKMITKDSSMRCDVLGFLGCYYLFWDATIFCSNFMPPKRRFWKAEQKIGCVFWSTFQVREYSIWATNRWKVLRKDSPDL